MAPTGASKHRKTLTRCWEIRAAPNSANNQVRHGDRRIDLVRLSALDAHERRGRLGDAGYILPAGYEDGGEGVRSVALQSNSSSLRGAVDGLSPRSFHLGGIRTPIAFHLFRGEQYFRAHIAPASRAEGHRR